MKTYSKAILAVSGLALSLAACGPGFKGEGTKKPNLQKQFKTYEKARKELAEQNAIIKSLTFGEADEDEMLVKVELANVKLADEKKNVVDAMLKTQDDVLNTQDVVSGTESDYTITLVCKDQCSKVVGILETSAKATTTSENTETSTQEEADEANQEAQKVSTQAGTTAPESGPEKPSANQNVRTGIVANSKGEILFQDLLDDSVSLEQNVEFIMQEVAKKAKLGLIQN